jgi:hypothetical protein
LPSPEKRFITILSGKYKATRENLYKIQNYCYSKKAVKKYMAEITGLPEKVPTTAPEHAAKATVGSDSRGNTDERQQGSPHQIEQQHLDKDQHALANVREQNADLLSAPAEVPAQGQSEKKSMLGDLKTKVSAPGYTEDEKLYLEGGWKEYLRNKGTTGYSLEEIARTEKLDSKAIKDAIAEGIITDPNALRVYGKLKLEHTKAYFSKWAAEHAADRSDAQEIARIAIAHAEAECTPLINGDKKDLEQYSIQQAQTSLARAKNQQLDLTDEEREQEETGAFNWLNFSNQSLLPEQQHTLEPQDEADQEVSDEVQKQHADTGNKEETVPVQNEHSRKQTAFLERWIADLARQQKYTEGEQNQNINKKMTELQEELAQVYVRVEAEMAEDYTRKKRELEKISHDKTKSQIERILMRMIKEDIWMIKEEIAYEKLRRGVLREQRKANNASGLSRADAFRKNVADYWKIGWNETPMQWKVRLHVLQSSKAAPSPAKQTSAA